MGSCSASGGNGCMHASRQGFDQGLAWTHLRDVDVDLVFAEHLPAKKVALMKVHARE